MIDEEHTFELYGYTSDELSHGSNKKIVVVCDECGEERIIPMYRLRDLCRKCMHNTPEMKKKHSEAHLGKMTNSDNPKWVDLDIESICKEYCDGLSTVELGKKYNCSSGTIHDRLRRGNVKIRANAEVKKFSGNEHYKYRQLDDKSICDEYICGSTLKELADKHSCSIATISRRLLDNEVEVRSQSEFMTGRYVGSNNKKRLDIDCQFIINEYEKGVSMAEIGRVCECGIEAIKNRLLDNGIKIRSLSESFSNPPEKIRRKISATLQGIPIEDWDGFVGNGDYCHKFNQECRTRNRDKYDNRCFLCNKPASENITKNGDQKALSVHHIDRNKDQGCNDHDWLLVPLCMEHHGTAHTKVWQARIEYLLDHVWITDGEDYE